MKKNAILPLIAAALILVAALVVWFVGGAKSPELKGGVQVRVNVRASYAESDARSAMESAGFNRPVLLSTNRTAIEIQADAMSREQLDTAAAKLLTAVQAFAPNAELAYAESYAAAGNNNVRGALYAGIGFAVLAFLYGWLRFGWRRALAAMLCALAAAVCTGGVCVLLSALMPLSSSVLGIMAAASVLSFIYSVALLARQKERPDYLPSRADLAVPALVVIACVAVVAIGGLSAVKLGCAAVLGALAAACFGVCFAPRLWDAFGARRAK